MIYLYQLPILGATKTTNVAVRTKKVAGSPWIRVSSPHEWSLLRSDGRHYRRIYGLRRDLPGTLHHSVCRVLPLLIQKVLLRGGNDVARRMVLRRSAEYTSESPRLQRYYTVFHKHGTLFSFFYNLLKWWSIYTKFLSDVAERILIQNIPTKCGR